MSNIRTAEISGLLTRWLERYSPPRSLDGNERAQNDEVQALLGVLVRFSPQTGYGDFVATVLEQLSYQMKTRAWPTVNEIGAVCANQRKEDAKKITDHTGDYDLRPEVITAKRMQDGKPVGEGWLYGANACEMIATGLITEAVMRSYRSGAFLSRKSVYGEAAALTWEAERKAHHDVVRYGFRDEKTERREISMPDLTSPAMDFVE